MREVDTSETSVVWPAWCYSGETTVNEDLPQRLVAAAAAATTAATAAVSPSSIVLLAQHKQHKQQKPHQHRQQSSSNQSRSSSASSASVSSSASSPSSSPLSSSSSPSPTPASPISPQSPAPRPPARSRGKRKSITRATASHPPSLQTPSSAIAAALEAGSVAASAGAASGAPLLGLACTGLHRLQRRPSSPSVFDSACDGRALDEGNAAAAARPSPLDLLSGNEAQRDAEEAAHGSVKNYHFGAIDTRVLRQHQATLHSLDKMLSERIYDRKKYLNSPTGGGSGSGGGGGGGGASSASAFYEKLRNGGGSAGDGPGGAAGAIIESQLNLIKNGGGPGGLNGTSAHLSAIAASIISNNNNNNNSSSNGSSVNNSVVGDGNGSASLGGNGSNGALASPRGTSNSSNQITSNKTSNSSSNSNNNNNSNTNNNNISSSSSGSIKSERLSPANNDAQSMASRSRSVTPSSFSGTPPQTMHASDASFPSSIPSGGLLPSPNSVGANSVGRPELQARNYSDFMRSLAAKYNNNNNNTNDVSNIKNSFPEPKMRFTQPKSYIEGSLSSKKGSPLTSTQVPNPSIMTSLFSGLPFQSAVFPPLIDMSSTQALVTLARAAKESDIHNILKTDTGGGLKKPSSLSRGSSPPATSTSLTSHHFPSPFATGYLPGLLPNHHLASFPSQPPPSAALGGPLKSPSRAPEPSALSTFPLDLSASTPSASKRIRLSSPTPSRHQETSPAPSSTNSQPSADGSLDLKATRKCHARVEELGAWTVDNVCDFVASIDICAEYVQNFRDQSIDGAGLPLLTEEHLTNSLGMKLGPALKLRSMLAKKLGGPCPCALCSVPTPPPARTNSSGSSSSKGDTTPTNRPPSNGSIG